MTDLQRTKTFLNRSLKALAYWKTVPKKLVDMDTFGFSDLTMCGTGRYAKSCGSVGCLAGWLQTMPSFRKHMYGKVKFTYPCESNLLYNLSKYFGEAMDFRCRSNDNVTEWKEGLDRLKDAVRTYKDEVKELS